MAIQEPIPTSAKIDDTKNPNDDDYRTFYHLGLFVYACGMLWQDLKIAITLKSVTIFVENFWQVW